MNYKYEKGIDIDEELKDSIREVFPDMEDRWDDIYDVTIHWFEKEKERRKIFVRRHPLRYGWEVIERKGKSLILRLHTSDKDKAYNFASVLKDDIYSQLN